MNDRQPVGDAAKQVAKDDAKKAQSGRPGKLGTGKVATTGLKWAGGAALVFAIIGGGTYYVDGQGGVSTSGASPTAIVALAPTTPPTLVPTTAPTTPPTQVPTAIPTSPPTQVPTAVPTTPPTQVPTRVPPTPVPTSTPPPIVAPPPTAEMANAATGSQVYATLGCASCHGPDAKSGPAGKNLPAASPELMTTRLRQGQGRMPVFGPDRLTDPNLRHLIAYLQSLR